MKVVNWTGVTWDVRKQSHRSEEALITARGMLSWKLRLDG